MPTRIRKCNSITLTAAMLLAVSSFFFRGSIVYAQDPISWQTSATGLSINANESKKTAGLGFIVEAQDWPTFSLRGGVEDAGYGKSRGPVGIELGSVRIPDAQSISLLEEKTDWAHNELTFSIDGTSELKLWVSRLTPALLLKSSSNTLQLLTGDIDRYFYDESAGSIWRIKSLLPGPVHPKYIAYQNNTKIDISLPGMAATAVPALNKNWMLWWYGDSSHIVETKKPLLGRPPHGEAHQADAPLLLIFENQPLAVKQADEGGLELTFQAEAGHIIMLPVFGREHVPISETETWSAGLPDELVAKINWWVDHLCAFPLTAEESYSYDQQTDTATINETISFLHVCSHGTRFAPIPPMLGLAQNFSALSFSAPLVDSALATEFGPVLGIEDRNEYAWSISGLKKFTDFRRNLGSSLPSKEIEDALALEVRKTIDAGHLAPWLFADGNPGGPRGDVYWSNPADVIYHLVEIAEALPSGSSLRKDFIDYIRAERQAYPPETIYEMELDPGQGTGTLRQNFSYPEYYSRFQGALKTIMSHSRLDEVPLYNLYSLAQYYHLIGEIPSKNLLDQAKLVLQRDMSEQDWATFYWFRGGKNQRIAIINANRYFAGIVGFIRLAHLAGDTEAEQLGRALLNKALVLRLSMARYPRYLYAAGLVELPPEPDWHAKYTAGDWTGRLYNYHWTGPYDDAQQVALLDQFRLYLHPHSGFRDPETGESFANIISPYLIAYRDMVPELALFLKTYAREESEIYITKVEALYPHWYAAFAEGALGNEHDLSHPINSFQIFMAKALIQQEPPDQLARYADIPWLEAGDLFYAHKLAETIKAYRGYSWE